MTYKEAAKISVTMAQCINNRGNPHPYKTSTRKHIVTITVSLTVALHFTIFPIRNKC